MYMNKFKYFKKFIACLLMISFIMTAAFQNTTFAGSYINDGLIGQELLDKLRELGLGHPEWDSSIEGTTPPAIDIIPPTEEQPQVEEQPHIQGDILRQPRLLGVGNSGMMTIPEFGMSIEDEQAHTDSESLDKIEVTTPGAIEVTTPGAIGVPNYPALIQRENLIEYVQGLTGEQIVSLDELDMSEEEREDFYTLLTFEQIETAIYARNPKNSFVNAGPLVKQLGLESLYTAGEKMTPVSGLHMDKKSEFKDGKVHITLEAYISGDIKKEPIPLDIVFVLDTSGSMQEIYDTTCKEINSGVNNENLDRYGRYEWDGKRISYNSKKQQWGYWDILWWRPLPENTLVTQLITISRMEALKENVNAFIDEAAKTDINHHIAIVNFESQASTQIGFKDVSNSGELNQLKSTVNGMRAEGATRSDLGLKQAGTLFTGHQDQEEKQRPKVVIMFTDGSPTSSNGFEQQIAADATQEAYILKNTHNATVYTIGVMREAAPEQPISNKWENDLKKDINRYMHAVSSNYPKAQGNGSEISLGEPIENIQKQGYYLAASNSEDLKEVFQNIWVSINRPNVTQDAVIKDYLSNYFQFPKEDSSVQLSLYNAVGTGEEPEWSGPKEAEDVTVHYYDAMNQITNSINKAVGVGVTGFDFWNNYVRKEDSVWKGSKIVIQFDVEPRDGFIGGNSVPTNTADSGIYEDGKGVGGTLGHFDVPTVDVPIQYDFTPYDQKVYITNQVEDLTTLLTEAPSEGIEYQIGEGDYKLGSPNNDFVDITYTVKQGDKEISTYTVEHTSNKGVWSTQTKVPYLPITDNYEAKHNYKIECSINPISTGTIENQSIGEKDVNVYVYTPKLTYENQEIYLGEDANKEVIEKLAPEPTWVCKGNEEIGSIEGIAPTLQYSYLDQSQSKIEDWWLEENTPIHVKVDVSKENTGPIDITKHTDIYNGGIKNPGFTIKVKTCELVINKEGEDVKENENFIFDITRTGNKGEPFKFQEKYGKAQVVIKGTGEVTLTGLPIGSYTVKEDENWSWRYNATQLPDEDIRLSKNNPKGKVTIMNTRVNDKWLTDEKIETNTFKGTVLGLSLFPQF